MHGDLYGGETAMNISVFGLGYVGCVSGACFAQMGHDIVGVDINKRKIDMINSGISPVIEKNLDKIIRKQNRLGRLRATTNAKEAVAHAEIIFVCVGTPSHVNGSINYTYIERVMAEIGAILKGHPGHPVIALRSTVLPGIVEEIVIPQLEKYSGKKLGKGFGFALNPEFLREGSSVYDFYHPPKTIIGAMDDKSARILKTLYRDLPAPIYQMAPGEASMLKYSDNAFHALKVSFANEVGRLCKSFNVDSRKVMDVFVQDRKLNLSPYYLKPGFAFGGSCLPKDLRAITYHAKKSDVAVPLLNATIESNAEHIRFALDKVKENGRKSIGVLGLSFKEGTDDLRESPVVTLVEQLLGKGYDVRIFDKNVTLARLMGANKEYIEREVPHIARLMCSSIEDVLEKSDVVVIGNNSKEYRVVLSEQNNGHRIIDLSGLANGKSKKAKEVNYEGICW